MANSTDQVKPDDNQIDPFDVQPMLEAIMAEATARANRHGEPFTDEQFEAYMKELEPDKQEEIRSKRYRFVHSNHAGCHEMVAYLNEIAKCCFAAADSIVAALVSRLHETEISEKAFKDTQQMIFMQDVRRLEAFEAAYKAFRAEYIDGQESQKNKE